ncbi:MAG: hypothetical protein K9G76_09960 [Bacteroidales bacterium]|nr:hypothetical protein [Bacteroidales bacterium]MCF8404024.1 hypothetical protein [Bacteroidales bacterium]
MKKLRLELSEYFDFLAYCLMPNHFHILAQVKIPDRSSDDSKSLDEPIILINSDNFTTKQISNKIAILLRSYTRAINKQEERIGSLFQQKTKAKCLNDFDDKKNDYTSSCFYYIHQNPYNAGIVKKMEDWKYSSFLDFAGLRNGTLCNQKLAFEIINFEKENFIEHSYAIIDEKNLTGIWL